MNSQILWRVEMSTFKRFVFLFVSVSVGTFVTDIMENININVWIARASGCLISVVVVLLLYKFFSRNRSNETDI